MISDNRSEFIYTVIVCGHASATEVYVLANVAVAHVGKMRYAGSNADFGILDFYKVAYSYLAMELCARAQMYEGTCLYVIVNFGVVGVYVIKGNLVSDSAVFYVGIRAYFTVLADNRLTLYDSAGEDNGIRSYLYILADDYAVCKRNINAIIHKS